MGRLVGLIGVLLVTGVWSISRVAGPVLPYIVYWRIPLAIVTVAVALGAWWYASGADRRPVMRRVAFGGLVVILVWSSAVTGRATDRDDSLVAVENRAQGMIDAIIADETLDGSVLVVRSGGSYVPLAPSVINEFDRAGRDVRVKLTLFGESRAATKDQVDEVLYVVDQGQHVSVLSGEPGADVLWQESALEPDDEQELRELQRQVRAELVRAGRRDLFAALGSPAVGQELASVAGIDQAAVDRIEELNQLVVDSGKCRCAAIAFSAEDAPVFELPL